jgi:hypothetical protein
LLCVIKALVAWVVLMLVGTNLLGMVVRGLARAPGRQELEAGLHPALSHEVAKFKRANVSVTVFFALLGLLYIYALLRFGNVGVLVAGAMLMLSRLPDLLWEIRTGQKVTRAAAPKGAMYILGTVMMWGALPLLWFALCRG